MCVRLEVGRRKNDNYENDGDVQLRGTLFVISLFFGLNLFFFFDVVFFVYYLFFFNIAFISEWVGGEE
jgi:hypothetical protein